MIDTNLARIIGQVESAGRLNALRFEPGTMVNVTARHLKAVNAAQHVHNCSVSTAGMICSTSWGLYQIMGFNIYNLGCTHTVFDYVADPAIQSEMLQKFLVADGLGNATWAAMADDDALLRRFATLYNGSGNVDAYMNLLTEAADKLGL